jgi:hypothetical protein
MAALHIQLSDTTRRALHQIAQRTGKSESEIIDEALQQFIEHRSQPDRLTLLQRARGIWKDRDDLPDAEELRKEWNRTPGSSGERSK